LEIIAKWEDMDIKPKIIGDRVISVYEAKIGKDGTSIPDIFCSNLIRFTGPPTQGKQYEKLLREESMKELAGIDEGVGDAHFINVGMRLERDQ